MKLLLVEDDLEISQMLKCYLTVENYEVVCAADGKSFVFAFLSVCRAETRDLM